MNQTPTLVYLVISLYFTVVMQHGTNQHRRKSRQQENTFKRLADVNSEENIYRVIKSSEVEMSKVYLTRC